VQELYLQVNVAVISVCTCRYDRSVFFIVDDTLSMSPVIPVFHMQSFFRQTLFVCIKTVIFNKMLLFLMKS